MATVGRRGSRSGLHRVRSALVLVVAAWAVAACGRGDAGAGDRSDERSVTVSAAASLRSAFEALGADLEAARGIEVTFNFDASSSLATQILEGAPADVYASAAPEDMYRLRAEGMVDTPNVFARNRLVLVTAPGNPLGISSLVDLTDAGIVSLCGRDVPCGRYAQRALDDAGVAIPEQRISRGQNVTATLTAVASGDAVAGIVYASDVGAADAWVEAIELPAADVTATYLIGVLDRADDAVAARAFVDLVLSEAGQAVLQDHGFLPAP